MRTRICKHEEICVQIKDRHHKNTATRFGVVTVSHCFTAPLVAALLGLLRDAKTGVQTVSVEIESGTRQGQRSQ